MEQNGSTKKSKFLSKITLLLGSRRESENWVGNKLSARPNFSRHLCNLQVFSSSTRARQAVSTHSEEFITYFSNSFICLLENIWITAATSQNFPLVSFLTW